MPKSLLQHTQCFNSSGIMASCSLNNSSDTMPLASKAAAYKMVSSVPKMVLLFKLQTYVLFKISGDVTFSLHDRSTYTLTIINIYSFE